MKKTAIRALSLLFAASLLTAGLTGCTQELEGAELTKAYETAVQNALAEDVYYWKETKLKGKNTESCQVNVFAGQGSNYEPLRDENGAYSEYKINLQQTSSQPQKAVRIYCGLSQGKEKKDEAKNYLFTQTLEEGQIVSCVKQPMTAAEYYQSEAFAPYLLSSRIAELKELTVADMDFSIKDGQAEQKVNVTELIFKPTHILPVMSKNTAKSRCSRGPKRYPSRLPMTGLHISLFMRRKNWTAIYLWRSNSINSKWFILDQNLMFRFIIKRSRTTARKRNSTG